AELALMNRMMIEDEESGNPMSLTALEDRMCDWLTRGAYEAVLIYRNDDIVGYVLYREETDEYDADRVNVFVRQFFVKRAYRRRGIGQTAFEQVAGTHFPDNATIVLEVGARSLQGRAFWERMGFEPFSTTYRRRIEIPERGLVSICLAGRCPATPQRVCAH
ncbi:MAG: GNAT family N-acetyltransferase, partial [Chloroflexota bacterium]